MTTACRVHAAYQARCEACRWSGEILASAAEAAADAWHHRRTDGHRATLRQPDHRARRRERAA